MNFFPAFLASLLLLPAISNAEEFIFASDDTTCDTFGQFAGTVMEAHQANFSFSQVLKILDRTGASEESKEVMRLIVMTAYQLPQHSAQADQLREIQQFESEIHKKCLRHEYEYE